MTSERLSYLKGTKNSTRISTVSYYMQYRDWYGDYPLHCHNVVHEDHAMMIRFRIVPPDDSKAGK